MWRKGNPHTLLVGMQIGAATVENSMEVSPKPINRTTIWSSNSIPGCIIQKSPKTLIRKDTCTPKFIASLFTIAKIWKQRKCPSADEWIKKLWYIYSEILLSHLKEWNFAVCSNMDGLGEHYAKWNCQRKTNTVWYHLYMGSKKYNKLVNITTKKQNHREQTSGFQWVEVG